MLVFKYINDQEYFLTLRLAEHFKLINLKNKVIHVKSITGDF
jgi:hypothetical protein